MNSDSTRGSFVAAKVKKKVKIITDPVTGLPVLSAGTDAPVLSTKDVREILANFP